MELTEIILGIILGFIIISLILSSIGKSTFDKKEKLTTSEFIEKLEQQEKENHRNKNDKLFD